MTDLGSAHSMATAINDLGQVVGYSGPSKYGPKRAFLWEDGIMTDLGTFGGTWSWARAINNLGQIVGDFWTDEHGYNYEHGFLWEDGIMTDLGSATKAFAINDPGQIVGYRTASNVGPRIAFLWEDGVMADLGEGIMPLAINNLGQVVGYRWVTGATRHAFLWEDGVMTDLGTLGSGNSFAYAINNLGQIAGTADNLPVIWSP
jgi:probable HAF family extracellular repeat protein